jgi:hypothetical protein
LFRLEYVLHQYFEQYKRETNIGNIEIKPLGSSESTIEKYFRKDYTGIEDSVSLWGCYLGEVIRGEIGGYWILDHKQLYLQKG